MQSLLHQTEAQLFVAPVQLLAIFLTVLRTWLKSARDRDATAAGEN